jgi:hypothetical protein
VGFLPAVRAIPPREKATAYHPSQYNARLWNRKADVSATHFPGGAFHFPGGFAISSPLLFDDFKLLPNDGKRIVKSFDFRDFHATKVARFSSKSNFDSLFSSTFYSSAPA